MTTLATGGGGRPSVRPLLLVRGKWRSGSGRRDGAVTWRLPAGAYRVASVDGESIIGVAGGAVRDG